MTEYAVPLWIFFFLFLVLPLALVIVLTFQRRRDRSSRGGARGFEVLPENEVHRPRRE